MIDRRICSILGWIIFLISKLRPENLKRRFWIMVKCILRCRLQVVQSCNSDRQRRINFLKNWLSGNEMKGENTVVKYCIEKTDSSYVEIEFVVKLDEVAVER